ncbi:PEGA domain-containing protein [Candidatus Daviesbacteria bacterium]|nr:PEGA domain-containing protein [Candidatus Daviesbacteria bacterium]
MKKTIVAILVLVSVIFLLLRFLSLSPAFLGFEQKSGVRVLSLPEKAKVFINGQKVGVTPYEDQGLSAKEYHIKLEFDQSRWEGKVKLISGTLTVVNRELTKDANLSAGETLTLEKGKGLIVVSNPSDAEVEIDGKYFGKTPLNIDLKPSEHTVALSHPSYLKRSIRANIPDGFRLTLSVDLGLSEVDLTASNTPVTTNTQLVIVKSTPTGFLRVRDRGSIAGNEVARVSPGDELVLLEEGAQWDRVRLPDGKEGFVSKSYIEKKQTP